MNYRCRTLVHVLLVACVHAASDAYGRADTTNTVESPEPHATTAAVEERPFVNPHVEELAAHELERSRKRQLHDHLSAQHFAPDDGISDLDMERDDAGHRVLEALQRRAKSHSLSLKKHMINWHRWNRIRELLALARSIDRLAISHEDIMGYALEYSSKEMQDAHDSLVGDIVRRLTGVSWPRSQGHTPSAAPVSMVESGFHTLAEPPPGLPETLPIYPPRASPGLRVRGTLSKCGLSGDARGPCTSNADCLLGVCQPASEDPTAGLVCRDPLPQICSREDTCSCTADWQCLHGACVLGKCQVLKIMGDPCVQNAECASQHCQRQVTNACITCSPAYCVGIALGETCEVRHHLANPCALGLYCDISSALMFPPFDNATQSFWSEPRYPITGVCREKIIISRACTPFQAASDACQDGTFCDFPPQVQVSLSRPYGNPELYLNYTGHCRGYFGSPNTQPDRGNFTIDVNVGNSTHIVLQPDYSYRPPFETSFCGGGQGSRDACPLGQVCRKQRCVFPNETHVQCSVDDECAFGASCGCGSVAISADITVGVGKCSSTPYEPSTQCQQNFVNAFTCLRDNLISLHYWAVWPMAAQFANLRPLRLCQSELVAAKCRFSIDCLPQGPPADLPRVPGAPTPAPTSSPTPFPEGDPNTPAPTPGPFVPGYSCERNAFDVFAPPCACTNDSIQRAQPHLIILSLTALGFMMACLH